MNSMTRADFVREANDYIERLKQAPSTDAVIAMWRSTMLPYRLESTDPHSPQYRDEVLSIYRDLSRIEYDVANEWTSSKQTPEEFEIGYPWVSKNLAVIADEVAKPIQILRALHQMNAGEASVIEFGSGWGNLSLPLAKAGVDVTMVDIDQGFIERALRIAAREGLTLDHRIGDFVDVARTERKRFDVAIFQSSFHHCLEFAALVDAIKTNVLKDDGVILFVNEPISHDLQFPWGLRYDGESLWAIMCNQWLELGFHHDFFVEMLLDSGFLPTRLDGIPGLLGEGWKAVRGEAGTAFKELILPAACEATFHAADAGTSGRFCQARSVLPRLRPNSARDYELTFVNYGSKRLAFKLEGARRNERLVLVSGERLTLRYPADQGEVVIRSDTFVPHKQVGNGDTRTLGIHLDRIATVTQTS
jgi:2-polyprenyl-3-methyl-5-hydroxy-6-metoxy-1,4-benzoquinol methylase